jgi:hypothetical protein
MPFQVDPQDVLQEVPQRPDQVNEPQITTIKDVLHKIIKSV